MSPRRFTCLLLALVLAVGASACRDVSVDPGYDLDVSLALDASTINAGDSARATVEVLGSNLWQLTMFWGDGTPDSAQTFDVLGAEANTRRVAHHYPAAGTFELRAFAVEQSGDTASAVATLLVDPTP